MSSFFAKLLVVLSLVAPVPWEIYPDHEPLEGIYPLTDTVETSYTADSHTELLGLYPGGQNLPPYAHFIQSLLNGWDIAQDSEVEPVCVTIVGMSNVDIWGDFLVTQFNADSSFSANVIVENFGESGGTFTQILLSTSNYRTVTLPAFEAASLCTNAQRKVLILGEPSDSFGNNGTNPRNLPTDFGTSIGWYADQCRAVIDMFLDRGYGIERVIITSPTSGLWGGVAGLDPVPVSKRPEPYCYEWGFGGRELIRRQIEGVSGYGYSEYPFIDWGPYFWSNGPLENPLQAWDNSTGFAGPFSAFDPTDGIHPLGDGVNGLEVAMWDRWTVFFHTAPGVRLIFNAN